MNKERYIRVFITILLLFWLIPLIDFQEKYYPNELKNTFPIPADSRTIDFSGYTWIVRSSGGAKEGPGPNYFNDSSESVWLDENCYLHLKIRSFEGNWYCSEVYTQQSFGYGMYVFQLSPGFEMMDINTIVGLFTYLDDFHEIDIEYSRWGNLNEPNNGQFVVQPYYTTGNMERFKLDNNGEPSLHAFYWNEDFIQFRAMYGTDISSISSDLIKGSEACNNLIYEWIYRGNDNPLPSTELVHINFWLRNGLPPTDLNEVEIVIEKFQFIPIDSDNLLKTQCNAIDGFSTVFMLLTVFGVILFVIKGNRGNIKKDPRKIQN